MTTPLYDLISELGTWCHHKNTLLEAARVIDQRKLLGPADRRELSELKRAWKRGDYDEDVNILDQALTCMTTKIAETNNIPI